MRIFLRTFNNKINSKTGGALPVDQYRGTPEWLLFQKILIDCLHSLGHTTVTLPELGPYSHECGSDYDKQIYVHMCKRDKPKGDLFWMQMHCRNLFTIDKEGWGADASNNDFKQGVMDGAGAKEFCESKSKELLESGTSKCDQPKATDETPERYILVPVQIPRDYTIIHHSPITVRYFIESIQAWAIETETQVCFKMHPCNQIDQDLHKIIDDASKASGFVQKVEGNIHELIRRSMGLFVINSGTGFEALIHGKPVCTFGDCDYNRVSFNADIRRLDEARNFIYGYQDNFQEMGYEFVDWYWHHHAYDVNDPNTPNRLTEYLRTHL